MAKARDIGRRMKSVESTRKITRTMEMVATSKLRRAQSRVREARPFADRLTTVVENLVTPELADLEPLLRQPDRIRRAAVILVTSNRGLCGAFNVNLIRKARALLAELQASDVETEFHVIGKKGISLLPLPQRGNGGDSHGYQRQPIAGRRPIADRSAGRALRP